MDGYLGKQSCSADSAPTSSVYSVNGSGLDMIRDTQLMMQTVRAGTLTVDARDASAKTPLMWCCHAGLTDDVQYLLSHGADVRLKDNLQRQAVHWCAEFTHSAPAIRMLFKAGSDLNAIESYGKTSLHWAVTYGNADVVRALLECGAFVDPIGPSSWTPLHEASWGRDTVIADWLLRYGADINAVDAAGYTALCRALDNETPTLCKFFLERGARTDVWDSSNFTPLHWAAFYDKLDMVRALLQFDADAGARSTAPGDDGGTPLDIAIEDHQNEDIIAAMLATPGALHSLFR